MQIRALDTLDLPLAWRRLLYRMRRFIDVPDRLPFEVVDRLSNGSPALSPDHHLGPISTVMATKGSGTVRPFVRPSPLDLLLYQALTDAIASDLERALGPRDKVFGYRLDTTGAEDPFADSPGWDDFIGSVREQLQQARHTHTLTGDIASYFIYIDIDELERRLLSVAANSAVVRDLGDLLRSWQQLGVRGLPQGVPPSSPLGNFYLAPLDQALESWGLEHRRYMDDFWVFAPSFHEARRAQDSVERLLYTDRLGLGGDKSRVIRTSTALEVTEPVQERIQRRRDALIEEPVAGGAGPYVEPDEVELPEEEIDEAAVHAEYDELVAELHQDRYPVDVRPRLTEVFRSLEKGRDTYAVQDVPWLLIRLPDLTWPAVRYMTSMRAEQTDGARASMLELLAPRRFHREQEWLHICRGGLLLRRYPAPELAARFGEIALTNDHPLVRARALLAWGKLSRVNDFRVADDFWLRCERTWQPYVLISLQAKARPQRDSRYSDWSGDGRFLRTLANAIQAGPFAWREL